MGEGFSNTIGDLEMTVFELWIAKAHGYSSPVPKVLYNVKVMTGLPGRVLFEGCLVSDPLADPIFREEFLAQAHEFLMIWSREAGFRRHVENDIRDESAPA
jgi:hypothetical protein